MSGSNCLHSFPWMKEIRLEVVAISLSQLLSHVQLFVTPLDCSPPGSFGHGVPQARILEWVAMSSSRGSSPPRDRTQVSHIAGGFFLPSEPPGKPMRERDRDYYKQPYANKMDNLEEMDKFLERYNLPRLNQKEIENMNGPNTRTKTETVI